uniref:Uncharacterized protein TCIL3000_11_8730 n=1 Tax=Trypanosoma congolense (strain IL3000) TaxID=1068625 RepID=G0V196_TRYCI|nr:unnamed protein product [Trypanosoma congolense IL3000]
MFPHESHIKELQRRFGDVHVIFQRPSETLLQVNHVMPTNGYKLTLYVALDEAFPSTAPTVAYVSSRPVSIAPQDPAGRAAGAWVPETSQLADAVENAFNNISALWGDVAPPTIDYVRNALQTSSDSMLDGIVSNPNCLESFAHQLSFLKKVRDARLRTSEEVRGALQRTQELQKTVSLLSSEVKEIQQRFESHVVAVQEARKRIPILDSVGTPGALAKTFAEDVKTLDMERDKIAKKLLEVDHNADKRSFDQFLEMFKTKAKERHITDLKRHAYRYLTT